MRLPGIFSTLYFYHFQLTAQKPFFEIFVMILAAMMNRENRSIRVPIKAE